MRAYKTRTIVFYGCLFSVLMLLFYGIFFETHREPRRASIIKLKEIQIGRNQLQPPKTKIDWQAKALRLTGESDFARETSIAELAKIPNLDQILEGELQGKSWALALDVISVLQMESLLPKLLDLAQEDQYGFFYLAINNLIVAKNRAQVSQIYRERVLCGLKCNVSLPSQIVMFETLGRLGESFTTKEIRSLFILSPWPEFQSSILSWVRMKIVKQHREQYLSMIHLALQSKVFQVLSQARALDLEVQRKPAASVTEPLFTPLPRTLDLHIAFGYKDARPARFVGDRYERFYLIQKLTGACLTKTEWTCGFQRDAYDGELFQRSADLKSGRWNVRIKMTESSAGPDDDDNRSNPYQVKLTQLAQNQFYSAIQNPEVSSVFYIGHSRDGGGPDFSPPQMMENHHVNYTWYKKNKPGLALLMNAIQRSKKILEKRKLKLGLFSCASTLLFKKKLTKESNRLDLITFPELLYYADALNMALDEIALSIQSKN